MNIEFDSYGAPKQYHISDKHPATCAPPSLPTQTKISSTRKQVSRWTGRMDP